MSNKIGTQLWGRNRIRIPRMSVTPIWGRRKMASKPMIMTKGQVYLTHWRKKEQ